MEASFAGAVSSSAFSGSHFNSAHLQRMGAALCSTMLNYTAAGAERLAQCLGLTPAPAKKARLPQVPIARSFLDSPKYGLHRSIPTAQPQ